MDNKLDPIHAVASLSLSMLEIQKDVSQLRRQVDSMTNQLYQLDQIAGKRLKELDTGFSMVVKKLEAINATNSKRKEDTSVDEETVRGKEG